MSTKQIIRSGLMGSAAIAALGLTACANSNAQSNRYGASTHYDYESAQSCGSSCTTGVTTPTFRPAPKVHKTHYGYEGVPCSTSCGAVTTGYPTVTTGTTHVTSYPSTPTYTQETAPCPVGTTSQPDGTCMQNGSHVSSYTGTSTYTGGSSYTSGSYSSGGYASSGGVADCPAGTTMQPDGSCLQRGGSSYSSHTSSTYTAPVTSTYSSTYVAPELVTECCAPVSSSTSVYSGDAVTNTYGGYATSGSTYSSSDYLPIRK
jgi:hypothetical protein